MIIILSIIAGFFIILAVLVLMRKSMWDVVHQNLIDLEDHYDGKIIRNGFASRPVFHGKVDGSELTINFSTAKAKSGRKTYIDFTLTKSSDISLTIAEKNWLKEESDSEQQNPTEIIINDDLSYIVMPSDNHKIRKIISKEGFRPALSQLDGLAYFFVGKSGTIVEFITDKIDRDTKFKLMKKRLEQINGLQSIINS
jgi:hypothetical protein